MNEVKTIIKSAQNDLRELLNEMAQSGGFTVERYVRFLSMQYHLTNGVQRHFFRLAAHPDFVRKGRFRDFLYRFGSEEEPHFEVAARDLTALDQKLLPAPLDVQLWWAFFDSVIDVRPCLRLGASCILENIGTTSSDIVRQFVQNSSFMTPKNTRFLITHLHEELPHGDQVLQALEDAHLSVAQHAELAEGSRIGRVFYLRFARWVKDGEAAT